MAVSPLFSDLSASEPAAADCRTGAQLAEKIALGYWNEVRQGQGRALFVRPESDQAFDRLVQRLQQRCAADQPWVFSLNLLEQSGQTPCFPLLHLARQFIDAHGLDIEQVCTEADLYPAMRPLFTSYLREGTAFRPEEPVIDEIDYEREQMLRSLQALLVQLSRTRPLLVLLNHLQAGQIGLWRLLQAMLLQPEQGRILLVAGFANPSGLQRSDDELSAWDDVVTRFGEHGVVVALEAEPGDDAMAPVDQRPAPQTDLALVLHRCRNAAAFLAFEEVIAWGLACHEQINDPMTGEPELQAGLLAVLGDAYLYLHAADEALIQYEPMLQIAQESTSDVLLVEAYRRMALACMNKHDATSAVRYGQLAIGCAGRCGDEKPLFDALLALFVVEDKFTRTLEDGLYSQLVDLAARWAGPSTRVYMLNMSYLYVEYYGNDFERLISLNSEALEAARTCHNEFALAVGYHKRSIIYGLLDDHRNSLECLRQSESIRSRLGNKLEVVRACNGIGYLCLMQDDYRRAWDYFTKAMQLFGSLRDYNEISMTLYNLASVYYRTGQYRIATQVLDRVIQIMGILGISHIPFRDIASIHALKGICHFREGNWIKGSEWLGRIPGLAAHSSDGETRCYVGILQCHVAALEHDVHRIESIFAEVVTALSGHYKAHARLLPWAVWEYAGILRQLGYEQNAQQQYESAAALARASGMRHLAGWIVCEQRELPRTDPVELPAPGFDLDALVAFARQEVTLKKLHHVVRNMNFLNSLQSLLGRSVDREALGSGFLRRILSFCPAQLAALHLDTGQGWRLLASHPAGGEELRELDEVLAHLQAMGPSVYLDDARQQPALADYALNTVINLQAGAVGGLRVNLLVATCDEGLQLGRDEKQVLGIALGQLLSVLEKLQQQDKLLYLSTIDELTGLANRKALRTHLRYELARLARYPQPVPLSVAYLDLDHFKQYNDTFGHAIGDVVLRTVVDLIRPCIRSTDYLARYGGDEFVLVLPETEAAQALQLAERIIRAVSDAPLLAQRIEQALGATPRLSPGQRLGCSVGLAAAHSTEGELEVDEILHRADVALYEAKRGGKNQAQLWKGAARG